MTGSTGRGPEPTTVATVFPGTWETAGLGRAMDWQSTALGPVHEWPRALQLAVTMALECPFPINLWCGPDLMLIYNDAYRGVLGAKHPAAFARPGAEVWSEIWPEISDMFDSIRDGGPPVFQENRRFSMLRDGSPADAWFTFSLSAIRDDEGAVVAFLNVAAETTARMLAESALAEANRAKSDFLAAMSHELRTPLNAIGGYAELIEIGVRGPVTPEQRGDLQKIQRSKDHLEGLVRDVLNFAKVGAGRVEYDLTKLDVGETIAAVIEMVTPQIVSRKLRLQAPDVPPGLCVFADVDKTRQILLNLIANALKFTPEDGTISLTVEPTADHVAVRVSDNGIGIPDDKVKHIFEPFVQAKSPVNGNENGVGLGLAISHDLALGMRCDLAVESAVGEGSTFTLTLPRCA